MDLKKITNFLILDHNILKKKLYFGKIKIYCLFLENIHKLKIIMKIQPKSQDP